MEAARYRRQTQQVVEGVLLIVVQDNDLVLKHVLHVLLRVEVEPVFDAKSAEVVKHLLLLEEVYLLGLLAIAFLVEADELKKEVLADLGHRLRHENLPFELRVHR